MPSSILRRAAALGTAAAAASLLAAGSASAAPTGDYAQFKDCPLTDPTADSCFYSETTSGAIKLGSANVPITKKIVLQGGYETDFDTGETRFIPAAGGRTLSKTPLNVPGGLIGLVPQQNLSGAVLAAFLAAIKSVNGVTATSELVGPVQFSFNNFVNAEGPAVTLPLRVKLDNPFLGNNCYIGSASSPVLLKLTAGTTAPPLPNQPITGSQGNLDFLNEGNLIVASGLSLVDNAFAAPAANGCGGIFSPIINPIVNSTRGLPAAAGNNSAVLTGTTKLAEINAVRASE